MLLRWRTKIVNRLLFVCESLNRSVMAQDLTVFPPPRLLNSELKLTIGYGVGGNTNIIEFIAEAIKPNFLFHKYLILLTDLLLLSCYSIFVRNCVKCEMEVYTSVNIKITLAPYGLASSNNMLVIPVRTKAKDIFPRLPFCYFTFYKNTFIKVAYFSNFCYHAAYQDLILRDISSFPPH
jgi:hypothetical protein